MSNPYEGSGFGPMMERVEIENFETSEKCYTTISLSKPKRYLTQADIDRLDPQKKTSWLNSCPGGLSTFILLIIFAAGMWAAMAIWKMRG